MKGQSVCTTGEVARLCRVSPKKAAQWFDSGLLGGYRLPGSTDRRVPRESLAQFMRENGFPMGELEDFGVYRVLLAGPADLAFAGQLALLLGEADGYRLTLAADAFAAGLAIGEGALAAAVFDHALGRSVALAMARTLACREASEGTLLIALANEDESPAGLKKLAAIGCQSVYQKPADPAAVAVRIRRHVEGS